jgi:hypothetical protein
MKRFFTYTAMPALAVVAFGCLMLASCLMRPYPTPEWVEIQPNQTAFLIPLEGASSKDQAKFQSVEMLKRNQVAVKRLEIPKVWKKTGYAIAAGKYMPAAKVILVDRNLVTREWKAVERNSSAQNQAIAVESRESITFKLQVMINAVIKEENAANFLYWYGGKSLEDVMDTNIRADVADLLAKSFGQLTLDECRNKKAIVFDDVRTSVTQMYAERGVTITTLGVNGGLVYQDEGIQRSMNEQFLSQNAQIIAQNKLEEQRKLNAIKLENAESERKAAEELAKSRDAFRTVRDLEIRKSLAERWDGKLPRFIMSGANGPGPGSGTAPAMLLNMPLDLLAEDDAVTSR